MSELVDKLISEAFSPKKGLAKRLDKEYTEAERRFAEAAVAIERQLAEAKSNAELGLAEAKIKADKLVADARLSAEQQLSDEKARLAQLYADFDAEWGGSLQAALRELCPKNKPSEWDLKALSRWLFDRRVFVVEQENKRRVSMGRISQGPVSFLTCARLPDRSMAEDLAAEAMMWDVSPDAFDLMLSLFNYDRDAMFEAFISPMNSRAGIAFLGALREVCARHGGDCHKMCCGNGVNDETIEVAVIVR